ncbi:hypothetical protein ANCCAN_25749, partial [Ancylostoma caninum]
GTKDGSFSSSGADDLRSFRRGTGFGGGAAGGGGRRSYSLVCRDRISEAKVDDCHCPPLQAVLWPPQLSFPSRSHTKLRFHSSVHDSSLCSMYFDHALCLMFVPRPPRITVSFSTACQTIWTCQEWDPEGKCFVLSKMKKQVPGRYH